MPFHNFSQHHPLQPILSAVGPQPTWLQGGVLLPPCPQAPATPVATSPPLPTSGHWVPHMGLLQSSLVLDSFQSSALCPRLPPGLCSCLLAHFQEASTVCLLAWTPTWVQSPAIVPASSLALTPPDHPALWTGHASSRWNSSRSLRWLCRFQQHLQLCLGT